LTIKTLFIALPLIFGLFATNNAHAQIITTIAGNGSSGYSGDGGAATAAQLYVPCGVATDNRGNLYIADKENNRIRKVNSAGIISTVAGTGVPGYTGDGGPAIAAKLSHPQSVAVDATGNLYIADLYNFVIRKVDTSGIINTFAGNGTWGYVGDGGPASAAEISSPFGVAADNYGNVYIADLDNNVIRKINASGVINTVVGNGTGGYSGDGGAATLAELKSPCGIAVDDSENIYISDLNQRIRKVNSSGVINTIGGTGVIGYSGDGGPATAAELNDPSGITVDRTGNVYIADFYNNTIRKINSSGIIFTISGNDSCGYSGDGGPATAAQLCQPFYMVTDTAGNIYFSMACWIRKITASNTETPKLTAYQGAAAIQIYPNPNTGIMHVAQSIVRDETVSVRVYSSLGQIVDAHTINFIDGISELNLAPILPGNYIVEFLDFEGMIHISHVVVE
jgi:trimeric autotransporter adhesin